MYIDIISEPRRAAARRGSPRGPAGPLAGWAPARLGVPRLAARHCRPAGRLRSLMPGHTVQLLQKKHADDVQNANYVDLSTQNDKKE